MNKLLGQSSISSCVHSNIQGIENCNIHDNIQTVILGNFLLNFQTNTQ